MEELGMTPYVWCPELCKLDFAVWLWACAWPCTALVYPRAVLHELFLLELLTVAPPYLWSHILQF